MKTLSLFLLLSLLPLAANADDSNIQVKEVRRGDRVDLVLTEPRCFRATVTLNAQLQNMRSSRPLPLVVTTKGQPRVLLATFRRAQWLKPWSYRWNYQWKYGEPLAGTPKAARYQLPFRGQHPLIQGPFGSFSHQRGSQDEQAYDWSMPVGTPVYAARDGVVVGTRSDVSKGGRSVVFKPNFNYVIVRHNDGTFAEYLHLQPKGARVRMCQRVTTNTVLGLSGNTGFTSTPHLHFALFRTLDGLKRQTLPIHFTNLAKGK